MRFYITFQSKYINIGHCFAVVEGTTYDEARQKVEEARGSDFAFMYTEEAFMPQIKKYGLSETDLHAVGVER